MSLNTSSSVVADAADGLSVAAAPGGLRLSRLTLAGFKSFADRTEFTFDDPITGIVGPNGCGKSNVVDAIKWVLGERSSKSLRGKEMIDVIFAGSAGRPPSGMASVTLSFENPVLAEGVEGAIGAGAAEQAAGAAVQAEAEGTERDAEEASEVEFDRGGPRRRALPIDADVVEVERRLYRDGTSQYLINGKRARLRDIRELFLDTGIGADAYSIIEQGKVDAMLLASPQERRTIFEEAAGIAKFKARKVEAQRKLERAQASLALTREQLASTERRLRIVKGQAAKARRFQELDRQLRATRLALAVEQYDGIRARIEELAGRIVGLDGVRREVASSLAELEGLKQEAELSRHELMAEHRRVEEERLACRHAREQAEQRRSMSERALAEARRQAEADATRLGDLERSVAELGSGLSERSSAVAEASERLAEAERRLEEASVERAGVLESIARGEAEVSALATRVASIDRERASLSASLEAELRRAEALQESRQRALDRLARLGAERAAVDGQVEELTQAVRTRSTLIGELERGVAERERASAALSKGRGERAQRVAELQQQYLRLEGRRQTLREMVEARVGLGEAVRVVLSRRDAGEGFAGVVAPLAELIDVERAYAGAVEAALGATLRSLVVRTLADLPSAEEVSALPGRVTFVPLSGLGVGTARTVPAHRWSESRLDGEVVSSGRAVPLRGVVRWRGEGEASAEGSGELSGGAMLDRVLGSTYLVESLDAGMLLGAVTPGARFVTREGVVLEGDGRVVAGPMSGEEGEPAGLLQRRGELEELTAACAALSERLESEREALRAVDAEASALAAEQSELRSRLAAEQRSLVGEQTRLERARGEAARLDRESRSTEEEAQQLGQRLSSLEAEGTRLRERIERLAALHAEQAGVLAESQRSMGQVRLRAEALAEQVSAVRAEASRLSEQVSAGRREVRRLEVAIESAQREQRELVRLAEESGRRLEEHRAAIAESEGTIAQAGAREGQLESLSAELSGRLAAVTASTAELGSRVAGAREHASAVEREWHDLEVSRRELEVKREAMELRASEEMGVELGPMLEEYRAVLGDDGSGVVVTRVDTLAAAAEIDALREAIRVLGNVNLDALEEETTLEARNEELVAQVADIDAATRSLEELIGTLSEACKSRFGEVFGRIQRNFAGEGGMFRKLFGGGKAEVRLMPLVREVEGPDGVVRKVETGEVDLLESGVEVIAKPPGKEPRSISQLSGGEKTLTAVALLLAIFQSKPSCFCVLDEVDAALDEGNVGRFCGVVREFTSRSHFIVITHNKKTMQAADRLFGVTMQERGVSTRVSVKFEQVGKDGSIESASSPRSGAERGGGVELGTIGVPPTPVVGTIGERPDPATGERKSLLRKALAGMRSEGEPAKVS